MGVYMLQSCLSLCNLWAVARQVPLSMGLSRQEYWNGLPCPPPGDLPDPGIKPMSLVSLALAGRLFITSATWEAPGGKKKKHPKAPASLNEPKTDDGCERAHAEDEGRSEVEAVRVRKSGLGLGRGASQPRPWEDSEEGKVISLGR